MFRFSWLNVTKVIGFFLVGLMPIGNYLALTAESATKGLPLVEEWQSRRLDKVYPIIYLDAIHIKIRQENKIKNFVCMICIFKSK